MPTLYERVEKGKQVRYVPYEPPEPEEMTTNLTGKQAITAAGTLGVILLTIFERNTPPHKVIARKIKAVEQAILNLYHDTGEPVDMEILDWIVKTWDRTMKEMSV